MNAQQEPREPLHPCPTSCSDSSILASGQLDGMDAMLDEDDIQSDEDCSSPRNVAEAIANRLGPNLALDFTDLTVLGHVANSPDTVGRHEGRSNKSWPVARKDLDVCTVK